MLKLLIILLVSFETLAKSLPLPATPGKLCSEKDPDFKAYKYPEKVAVCKRDVSKKDKKKVAKIYGNLPESEWKNYEFDHLYPLCMGGSNNIANIWPQIHKEAYVKDAVEGEVCAGIMSGRMTQKQAVEKIQNWFKLP